MMRKVRIALVCAGLASLMLLAPALLIRGAYGQGRPTAVFMGDSIIRVWVSTDEKFFRDNNYLNRGIDGQPSGEMVQRFETDVIKLKPGAVVILAGTNDIAETRGPVTDDQFMDNLRQMAELARANNINVVVGSITPADKYWWGPGVEPASRIVELNSRIKAWTLARGFVYADFWSAMTRPEGTIIADDFYDGVHPSGKGFAVMEPIAKAAIESALKSNP